ncbi:MAG: tRNA (cytidine(34)-2'-O)-methyltransferase [Sulfurifustaceae bacterium]
MFNVILYEPEIPSNTGNIMRLCANTGARLHLIEPLGFVLDDRRLRRAGLDYRDWAEVRTYPRLDPLLDRLAFPRLYAFTTRARRFYSDVQYREGDALLFGPETRGLPASLLERLPPDTLLRLPLQPDNRSLNLSNAVAIVVYEAWRQLGFAGGA